MNKLFFRKVKSETKSLTWFGNYDHLIDLDAQKLPDNMILLNREYELVGIMGTNYTATKISVILPFSHIQVAIPNTIKKKRR